MTHYVEIISTCFFLEETIFGFVSSDSYLIFQVLEAHDREAEAIKRKLFLEQQSLRRRLSQLSNAQANNEQTVIIYKSDSSTSSEEEIDVENDDETGYGSADDRLSTSSSNSCSSVL